MITNNDIKYYASLKQKKFREKEKKFLIEGKHLIQECLAPSVRGFHLEMVFIDEKTFLPTEDSAELISKAKNENIKIEKITAGQLERLADTETPQGIVGVVRMKKQLQFDYSNMNLVIALDSINDPGNLGTIIRTSYWFGVDCILLSERSVDIYNPKVIRSSQGAIFHVNFFSEVKLLNELKKMKSADFSVYILTTHTNKLLNDSGKNNKNVFVFGNESSGVSEELLKAGFENIKVESYSNCESLNVGVSVGIVLDRYRNR